MHFHLRHWPDAIQWGLHSATFYFLNSVHALCEEHRYVHTLTQEGRAAADAIVNEHLPILKFIFICAEALAPEARSKVALRTPMHGTL